MESRVAVPGAESSIAASAASRVGGVQAPRQPHDH
jgi:hypothetical protein